jgi:hypothetical protein
MVCYSLVRLNTTFTRLTGHLQGFHTVPPTFIRYWHGWAHSYIYGLSRSCTIANTIIHGHGFKSFKNHTRLSRIQSNGPSVSRIRPRLVRLYVRFTRVANRISRVFCVRQALDNACFLPKLSLVDDFQTLVRNYHDYPYQVLSSQLTHVVRWLVTPKLHYTSLQV